MAWHLGHPLTQTLFNCLYIERLLWPEPANLNEATFHRKEDPSRGKYVELVLRAYCLGVLKCCEGVIQTVIDHLYFEEEDLCTRTYNRQLLTRISAPAVEGLFHEAEAFLYSEESRHVALRLV